ncbi:MAG TPA: GNAT family N-acetyltransferase [Methylophilaceae bacterium]|jgi:GNAT superfamily N-acetyltransferase
MQKNIIEIENAQQADIPALITLLDTLFSIEADFEANTEKQTLGLAMLLSMPDRAVIKVARNEEQQVVGMVSAQLVISTAQGTPSAWVEDMVVDASYRGCGIGKRLLEAARDWAIQHGASRMQLLVDTANQPALDFYEHLGWETTQLNARKLMLN